MSLRPALSTATAIAALLVVEQPAAAQATAAASSDGVIARACSGHAGKPISQLRLGESLLIESGVMPSEFVADLLQAQQQEQSVPADIYKDAVLSRLAMIELAMSERATDDRPVDPNLFPIHLIQGIDRIRDRLRNSDPDPPLAPQFAVPLEGAWLFAPASPEPTFLCKPGRPPLTRVGVMESGDPKPAFSIREKPEELPLLDDERRAAGSFALGLERTRTIQEDGSRKTQTDVSIKGTVGVRVSPASSQTTTAYLFGRYELQRSRTNPAPALDPGAKQSDDDTDVLETGATVQTELLGNDSVTKLYLTGQASAIFDFANDARRLKLRALLRPAFDTSLGICGLGSYEELDPSISLKARCRFQFDIEGAKVLRQGTSPLGDFDTFLAAGGQAEFELLLPASEGMDVLGTLSYRYLPVLHGGPKSIERFEAALKWRFWTSSQVGLDVGFSYLKGTNELSFEKEDVLTAGLGIIF